MKRYLVTGGSGFIGLHIAETLRDQGLCVRVLDNRMAHLGGVEFVKGDIRRKRDVEKAMVGIDYVLHQAAIPSTPRSLKNPIATNGANAEGTLRMLSVARHFPIERFVYASSSSVYGTPAVPKHEYIRAQPASPYAVSKYCGELYCNCFHEIYNTPVVILRYFNVYGPRQNPNSQYSAVIPKFMRAAALGEEAVIYGDGEQTRDFTYVGDVVHANVLACESESAVGKVFNIGSGVATTVLSLLNRVSTVAGQNIQFRHADNRPGDVRHSLASIEKARRYLGYQPEVDLDSGLAKTWQAFNCIES